jgi:signal transduction histidine kinase/ligand-binding sensor domain-containing protein/DNA-binding response OmpR family regulator
MRSECFILLLFCFSIFNVNAQDDDVMFRRVSPISGFSFQAIRIIRQDVFGYIWMGTYNDGVIRYNSKGIVHFTHDPKQGNGLPSDKINSLVIDKQNNIWVQSDIGICLYNHTLQQFEQVHYSYENGDASSNQIKSIALDGEGRLWIADNNCIGYLDLEKKQLVRINKGLHHTPEKLYSDELNRLWLGTIEGTVYLVQPDKEQVVKKIDGPGSMVRTIFATLNEVWVGYENHGARLYDLNGKLKTHYSSSSESKWDIKSTSVRKIWRDTRGRIWIGTYIGLFMHDGEKLTGYDVDEYKELPSRSIFEIFEDEQGGIWIGTWAGGVVYAHPTDNKFSTFQQSNEPYSLSNNIVSSFAQAPDGRLYIGTEGGGINEFNLTTKEFKKITISDNNNRFNIKSILFDKKGGLWVGTGFNGLFYKPNSKSNFLHFSQGKEDGMHISGPSVHSLCESDSGIYIGTNLDGVDFYDFKSKQITFPIKIFPHNVRDNRNIRSLTIDSHNILWIAAVNGIHQYHIPSKKMIPFGTNFICPHNINHEYYFVSMLSDGTIWMGTRRHGVEIYNPRTKETKLYNANGLLEGKDAYGIIEGKNNNVWITSNNGLIQYNTKEKSSRRFIYTDGIQGDLFSIKAIFKDKDENLYFGGTNGFTLLEPNKIKINKRPPNVFINRIEVKDRELTPFQTSINNFQEIELEPVESTIKFDFSTDNYLLPGKNKFSYKLVNYMDEWIEVDNSGSVTLVNVPAGKYIFKVRGCNNDGVWSKKAAILPIVMKQLWYMSKLAIVLYLLAVLAIIGIIIRFYIERLKLKKTVLIERLERENEDQLHEMKLRFFTNISHEFRTPLTLINWPIKNLLGAKNLSAEQLSQLDTIKRNTNRLLQLINQIMDLRKVERNQTKLNISKIELAAFVAERMLNFAEEAKSKNIQFSLNHIKDKYVIEADEEKLDKIIYNLLSNAFKFGAKDGKIEVILQDNNSQSSSNFSNQLSFGKLENEDFAEIIVVDYGEGIDSEDMPNIFNRFEQGKHKKAQQNSTGIGLNLCKEFTILHRGVIIVQSTPGEGTRFSVRFPIRQQAQKILYESHLKVKNIDSWETPKKSSTLTDSKISEVTILVVEDNEELRKFIVQFLQSFYTILSAKNGEEGLGILSSQDVHLVISDVMMPIMDGFEFCQTIKSKVETSHIPVILLTALSSVSNTVIGLAKGADAYISKPFDESVLLSQVRNLLLQRKRLQESYTMTFMAKQPINVAGLDNYFLNKVNTVIEDNIENENFSVEIMAQEIGLSRSQLNRKLKQISNYTSSEYILMVKIRKATALLASKGYTIDEVAYRSGFNSHSYFTRCFKKIHNQSPKEFLKNL